MTTLLKIRKTVLRKAVSVISPILLQRYFRNGKSPLNEPIVCLTFDCDMQIDYDKLPTLLDLLKKHKIKVTFGIIGKWLEKYPEIHKRILREGHEIVNHTYTHPNNDEWNDDRFFNKISEEEQEEEMREFDKVCQKILRYKPRGFRTPHFGDLTVESVYKLCDKLGYEYSSSAMMSKTKNGGVPFRPKKGDFSRKGTGKDAYNVLELPVMSCPEHFYPILDSVHCTRPTTPAHSHEFVGIFAKSVELAEKHKLIAIYDFGPQDAGGYASEQFENILKFLKKNKIKTATLAEAFDAFVRAEKKR